MNKIAIYMLAYTTALVVLCGCGGASVDVFPLLVVTREKVNSRAWNEHHKYHIQIVNQDGDFIPVELPEEVGTDSKFVTPFGQEGVALVGTVTNRTDNFYVINTKGEILFQVNGNIVEHVNDRYTGFSEGIASVESGGETVAFNTKGEEVFRLSEAKLVSPFVEGRAYYEMKKYPYNIGVVDKQGNIVLDAESEDWEIVNGSPNSLAYGLVCVKNDGKYGIIDLRGNEVLACEYDNEINIQADNRFVVKQDDCYGVVDRSGEEILPFEYDWLMIDANRYQALLKDDEEVVWIDRKGETVLSTGETGYLGSLKSDVNIGGFHDTSYALLGSSLINEEGEIVLDELGNVQARFEAGGHHYFVSCFSGRVGYQQSIKIVNEEGEELFGFDQNVVNVAAHGFIRHPYDYWGPSY